MDKNDILDYVTETPGNTNRAVLGSMLDSFSGGGGGGAEPLIVNTEYDDGTYTLDKTFGEIRGAFESGNVVLVVTQNTDYGLEKDIGSAIRVSYAVINDDPSSTSAEVNILQSGGSVMTYSVHLDEAPYTLDALDAKYPSFINQ